MANPRMDYAWGSTTSIPEFLGEEATGLPVAEVWVGAHPKAPSVLLDFHGADTPLDEAIREHPWLLGDDVAARFGELPYLVKLLAAGSPLSLQVHPSAATAREGFAREEADGFALDAPERTFKDPHHKPEAMFALAPTATLAGFRPAADARALLGALRLPWADGVAGLVGEDDLARAFAALLDEDAWAGARESVLARCAELVEASAGASREGAVSSAGVGPSGFDPRDFALVLDLDSAFPGDPGVAAPLLLNVARYDFGEVLFVPTGELHAHLSGFGIEVMAASDNVIRAGLTPKYVDVAALFGSLVSRPTAPQLLATAERMEFPVREFAVSLLGEGDVVEGAGPRVLLAADPCTLRLDADLTVGRGESVFIADGESPRLLSGRGVVVSAN